MHRHAPPFLHAEKISHSANELNAGIGRFLEQVIAFVTVRCVAPLLLETLVGGRPSANSVFHPGGWELWFGIEPT